MNKLNIGKLNKALLCLNIVILLIYFSWWFNLSHMGNPLLYSLLFMGEIYHVGMAISFWFTLWPTSKKETAISDFPIPVVDVFITVAGEPVEIVRKTIEAAKNIEYPKKNIYILNDGLVTRKENWREISNLARELDVSCITRTVGGGAKAGNINNGLKLTDGEMIAILDADMVAHQNFLAKTIPFFKDPQIGFVQTPQYYKNHSLNDVTRSSWQQQELFFGAIMEGKNKSNASFMCGTNMVIRREALMNVGGMNENNIAEDFLTSLSIHQKGWKSHYVAEVLVEGLAPEDLLSYFKQQTRWARGSLEVLFSQNPIFKKGLKLGQKIEYFSSALYYFNGVIIAIDAIMPLIFLYFGIQPVSGSTSSFVLFFLPFMLLNLYTLFVASRGNFTYQAISFSYSSWTLQLIALVSLLTGQKMAFSITPKKAQEGNFFYLVIPHIVYIFLFFVGLVLGIARDGLSPAVVTNIAWGFFNVFFFLPFIQAAGKWNFFLNNKFFVQLNKQGWI